MTRKNEDNELIEWVKSLHPENDERPHDVIEGSGVRGETIADVLTGPMPPGGFKVDGIDYSPAGIRAVRDEVIGIRDSSFGQWPEAIPFTLLFTHVIALLENYAELTDAAGEYITAVESLDKEGQDGDIRESGQGQGSEQR